MDTNPTPDDTEGPRVHWSENGAVMHPFHPHRSVTSNDRDAVTCTLCLDLLAAEQA